MRHDSVPLEFALLCLRTGGLQRHKIVRPHVRHDSVPLEFALLCLRTGGLQRHKIVTRMRPCPSCNVANSNPDCPNHSRLRCTSSPEPFAAPVRSPGVCPNHSRLRCNSRPNLSRLWCGPRDLPEPFAALVQLRPNLPRLWCGPFGGCPNHSRLRRNSQRS